MDVASIIAAFSDSPALQETLSVLLENECELQFLTVDSLARRDVMPADVALVAMRSPDGLLNELATHWPTLPVVTVIVDDAATHPLSGTSSSVRLDPNAVRTAVRVALARHAAGIPASAVARIADGVRVQLAVSFTGLRAVSGCTTQLHRPEKSLLSAVLHQESVTISEMVAHLEAFRTRPRRAVLSSCFLADLCGELERSDAVAGERNLICSSAVDLSVHATAGPVTLVPTLGGFLRAHLRRSSRRSTVQVSGKDGEITIRYRVRPPSGAFSLPLLLTGLALQPWSWRVFRSTDQEDETVRLTPAVGS